MYLELLQRRKIFLLPEHESFHSKTHMLNNKKLALCFTVIEKVFLNTLGY